MGARTVEPLHTALRKLMDERGMAVKDLWASADLHPSDVYRYLSGERGRRMNSQAAASIEKMAKALGVRPDYFQEYRQWIIQEIARRYPGIVDEVYDLLVAHAASAEARESKRRSKGT